MHYRYINGKLDKDRQRQRRTPSNTKKRERLPPFFCPILALILHNASNSPLHPPSLLPSLHATCTTIIIQHRPILPNTLCNTCFLSFFLCTPSSPPSPIFDTTGRSPVFPRLSAPSSPAAMAAPSARKTNVARTSSPPRLSSLSTSTRKPRSAKTSRCSLSRSASLFVST